MTAEKLLLDFIQEYGLEKMFYGKFLADRGVANWDPGLLSVEDILEMRKILADIDAAGKG